MSNVNHQFKCRVFAGKIISIDCPGFPSELFAAKIIDGRIALQNIYRKQCNEKTLGSSEMENNASAQRKLFEEEVPLANSTPARSRHTQKENKRTETQFPTPDIVRRAVTQQRSTAIHSPNVHQRLKCVPLHRTPLPNTPTNLAKIVPLVRTSSNKRGSGLGTEVQILRNLTNLSNFELPSSPRLQNNTTASRSPNQSWLISSPLPAVKWRKCITPQKTYVRRSATQTTQIPSNKSNRIHIQVPETHKVVPNYFLNQTKYPSGEGKFVFLRRKLIIDKKVMISPKKFKKQLKCTKDLECVNAHLPKTRKQFMYSHQLAFDLLTNSSYYPRTSKTINSLFRRGCLNKKSDTILKYQQLIKAIPELKE